MKPELRPLLGLRRAVALLLILLSLALAGGFSFPALVQGQSRTVSLSISPVIFELTMNPGETRDDVITVRNASETEAQTFTMSVEPFVGTETGEAIVIEEGDPAYSLKEWVKISPQIFTLGPKESKIVNFHINVPAGAEPGGRYGSILASSDKNQIGQTGAVTVQKVGSLVLLTVRGVIDYRAFVESFTTVNDAVSLKDKKRKSLFQRGPVNFIARIRNEGTVHIKPQGFVAISNFMGKKIADIKIPPRNVLPDSNRAIEIKWDNAPIGYYTATFVANYGDKNEQLIATTTFTVFPWKIGLPIIAAALAALWFIIARRQRVLKAIAIIFGRS